MPSHDAIVIGAGLIGSAIALRLAQDGLRVAVLEKNVPGREASWAGAGMLSPAPDSAASIPLVPFGRASLSLYPQFVAEIEEISGRRAGYRKDGAIELLFSADAERELSTLIALHHALGLPSEPLPLDEAYEAEPGLTRRARAAAYLAVRGLGGQSSADGGSSRRGLAHRRGNYRADAQARQVTIEGGRCSRRAHRADGDTFSRAREVDRRGRRLFRPAGGNRSQARRRARFAARWPRSNLAKDRFGHVVRCEHGYIVPRDSAAPQRLVIGSTLENAGFDKRVTAGGMEKILSMAQELVPKLAHAEVSETWSGLRPDTPDHLPLLGPAGVEGLTIATGHFRNGILLTPITAKLVREWIVDKARFHGLGHFQSTAICRRGKRRQRSASGDPLSGQSCSAMQFARK